MQGGEPTPIQMIPGLARNYPVFSRLQKRLPGSVVVDFIEPQTGESLCEYVKRFAGQFDADCFIVGVSFGGIVATEIARLINPKGCVLISTVRSPEQLPKKYSLARMAGGKLTAGSLVAAGRILRRLPRRFRPAATVRLSQLSGAQQAWYRWAISAVVDWRAEDTAADCVPACHIHGDADTVFPIRRTDPNVVIRGGGHSIAVTHAEDVAVAIENFISAQARTAAGSWSYSGPI